MQISKWALAKLKQLPPTVSDMPILPIMAIQGHDWTFMLAEMNDPTRITIHQGPRPSCGRD